MKNLSEKFQKVFMAVAFTDLGEFGMAKEMIAEKRTERMDQKRDVQKMRKMPRIPTPRI